MRYGNRQQGGKVGARQCSNISDILHLSLIQEHRRNWINILIYQVSL